jgi:hypothetical protein
MLGSDVVALGCWLLAVGVVDAVAGGAEVWLAGGAAKSFGAMPTLIKNASSR